MTLILHSHSLLSKWGFGDGDMPDHVWDALEDAGVDTRAVDWHTVLRRLVRERLLPALDQDVEVTDIETNHNPTRATTINGVDVERFWYGDQEDSRPELSPDFVEVPLADVLAALRQN